MTFDDLFALTAAGDGRWLAAGAPPTDERMLFGGLVLGQAIVAASQGTRRCHALHALFIGMGAKEQESEILVERTRDGGSFSTRNIQVLQGGRLLLAGYSSHHDGDAGPEHEISMPKVPPPESVEEFSKLRARQAAQGGRPAKNFLWEQMLDMRGVEFPSKGPEPVNAIWFRARAPIAGPGEIHQAGIAFASDIGPIYVGLQQHRAQGLDVQTASLDHSIWFHRQARADEWLMMIVRSPIITGGRGIGHAQIFNREGHLVASVAQEFLARSVKPSRAK